MDDSTRYITLRRAGASQHRALHRVQCALSHGVPLGRDGVFALHGRGRLPERALSHMQGKTLTAVSSVAERCALAADARLLRAADPHGCLLVDHGRVGPLSGEMVCGERCQRHLRRCLQDTDHPDHPRHGVYGRLAALRHRRVGRPPGAGALLRARVGRVLLRGLPLRGRHHRVFAAAHPAARGGELPCPRSSARRF